MFQIGQEVVYPVHGAGVIEGIEQREILGQLKDYYVLRISAGDLQVLIPVDGVENAGLREVCDKATIAEVRDILQDAPGPWEENWNRRYRLNMDRIKSGSIRELAGVVRDLTLRDRDKGLSAGEKKMLDSARKVLVSEIVMVEGGTVDQVTGEVKELINRR